jgi:SAM-dependent methyltransferase
MLPREASVLDVGCGDGSLAKLICDQRPDVEMRGIDVLVRERTAIPVEPFDGAHIPADDGSFDAVMFVDVLHHTDDPRLLLREARRVTRRNILIKDHTCNGLLARPVLRFMDGVGNERFGVALPYNYWTQAQWQAAFRDLHLEIEAGNRALASIRLGGLAFWAFAAFRRVVSTRLPHEHSSGAESTGSPNPDPWEAAYLAFETPAEEVRSSCGGCRNSARPIGPRMRKLSSCSVEEAVG